MMSTHASSSTSPLTRDRRLPVFVETLRGSIGTDVSLARHVSWRTGGVADMTYTPTDSEDLACFLRQLPAETPVLVLGLGSNVLMRDGGVRGVVVLMHDTHAEMRIDDGLIYAPAGLASPKLARFAVRHGFVDAAFLAGIPGTVGGALAMNAGCHGDETWAHVARVEVVARDGQRLTRTADDYEIGYRSVRCKAATQEEFFVGAWWRFTPTQGDVEQAVDAGQAAIKALLARRLATQPLELPNAGSVFRNPPGDYAARLIELCGLKGYSVGQASVSTKHANFIVNPKGLARAADIEALIAHVQTTVLQKTGVRLQPEVKIIGEAA